MSNTITLLAAAALAFGGCASAGAGERGAAEDRSYPATIRVENDRWFNMNVFIEGGVGGRYFLGTVRSQGTNVFQVPVHLLKRPDLRLVADPSGSTQQMISEPIRLDEGRNLKWSLRKTGGNKLYIM